MLNSVMRMISVLDMRKRNLHKGMKGKVYMRRQKRGLDS